MNQPAEEFRSALGFAHCQPRTLKAGLGQSGSGGHRPETPAQVVNCGLTGEVLVLAQPRSCLPFFKNASTISCDRGESAR